MLAAILTLCGAMNIQGQTLRGTVTNDSTMPADNLSLGDRPMGCK